MPEEQKLLPQCCRRAASLGLLLVTKRRFGEKLRKLFRIRKRGEMDCLIFFLKKTVPSNKEDSNREAYNTLCSTSKTDEVVES